MSVSSDTAQAKTGACWMKLEKAGPFETLGLLWPFWVCLSVFALRHDVLTLMKLCPRPIDSSSVAFHTENNSLS